MALIHVFDFVIRTALPFFVSPVIVPYRQDLPHSRKTNLLGRSCWFEGFRCSFLFSQFYCCTFSWFKLHIATMNRENRENGLLRSRWYSSDTPGPTPLTQIFRNVFVMINYEPALRRSKLIAVPM